MNGVTCIPAEISSDCEAGSALHLIRDLCHTLRREEIDYCHWKSTAALDRSASGENDLDLLVGSDDVQRFAEILLRLGFKKAQAPLDEQTPGICNYYGFDRASGQLVHVHAHYQLVIGHDATKNYHLPIEEPYLRSAVQGELFKVPSPEFEFVVFVIRMVIKHSTWDTMLYRQGALSTSEKNELAHLASMSDRARVYDILAQHLPQITAQLFDHCLHSLYPGCPLIRRIWTGHKLHQSLAAYTRKPPLLDLGLKARYRFVRPLQRRLFGRTSGMRVERGGLTIGIVGGDGSGKSTAINGLYAWLSRDFDVMKVHMGKPRWSRTTTIVRGILKIGRALGLYPFERAPILYSDTGAQRFPGYPWLIREVCTARDRYLTYAKARRFAITGGLVICDRFYLPQIELMDGPQGDRLTSGGPNNVLVRLLTRMEKKYYPAIGRPDLLVVLRVNPETAVRRKTDEEAGSVRARCREVWLLDAQSLPAQVIDAERSASEVLSELKTLVWAQF